MVNTVLQRRESKARQLSRVTQLPYHGRDGAALKLSLFWQPTTVPLFQLCRMASQTCLHPLFFQWGNRHSEDPWLLQLQNVLTQPRFRFCVFQRLHVPSRSPTNPWPSASSPFPRTTLGLSVCSFLWGHCCPTNRPPDLISPFCHFLKAHACLQLG